MEKKVNMLEKVKTALNNKLIKYIIIPIIFMSLFIIVYSGYLLSKNIVKMDIPEITDKQKGSFINIGNIGLDANRDLTSTLLPNGKVLIVSGRQTTLFDQKKKIIYLNRFLPFLGYPIGSPKFYHIEDEAILLPGGKVILFNGNGSESFDYRTNRFSPIAGMLVKRSRHTATLLPNAKVLITGGYSLNKTNTVTLDSAELYDPQINKFTFIGKMSTERVGHTATLLKDGRVLIVGGNKEETPYAELYDYKMGKFYSLKNTREVRAYHKTMLLPNRKVIIVGGHTGEENDLLSVELFDPETNKFNIVGKLITPRSGGHSVILLNPNNMLIVGGYSNKVGYLSNAEVYDLKSNKSALVKMYQKYFYSRATLLNDMTILITGTYLFDPVTQIYIP